MSAAVKILFADDDPEIREVLRVLLEGEGYETEEAVDGRDAAVRADGSHHLIILDVLMPGLSGFEACEQIRKTLNTPVLFLTAKSQDTDKVRGFASGGDDYLVKPFSAAELLARVKAMLRRYKEYGSEKNISDKKVIRIGELTIDDEMKEVFKGSARINVTSLEYRLLLLLAQEKGRVFTSREIYERVWNDIYLYQSNNTVMVHMRNLRKKLEDDPKNPRYIKTIWGKGYSIG